MTYETILTEVRDGVLVITLNRPERLNAWTYQMGGDLNAAVQAANADDDINAIVITGAGRGFCAGADIEAVFKAQSEGEDVSEGDAAVSIRSFLSSATVPGDLRRGSRVFEIAG